MNILNIPGLLQTGTAFIRSLVDMSLKNGWDPSAIAAVMKTESGFNPSAKNPDSTATGLIQFTRATAEGLGTTVEALRNMSAIQQLTYVEKFFQRNMKRIPTNPADYKLAVFGRSDLIGTPDDTVAYRADDTKPAFKAAYEANRTLDRGDKGYITAGDLRAVMAKYLSPSLGFIDTKTLVMAAGGAELLFWAGLGFLAWRKARKASR